MASRRGGGVAAHHTQIACVPDMPPPPRTSPGEQRTRTLQIRRRMVDWSSLKGRSEHFEFSHVCGPVHAAWGSPPRFRYTDPSPTPGGIKKLAFLAATLCPFLQEIPRSRARGGEPTPHSCTDSGPWQPRPRPTAAPPQSRAHASSTLSVPGAMRDPLMDPMRSYHINVDSPRRIHEGIPQRSRNGQS